MSRQRVALNGIEGFTSRGIAFDESCNGVVSIAQRRYDACGVTAFALVLRHAVVGNLLDTHIQGFVLGQVLGFRTGA